MQRCGRRSAGPPPRWERSFHSLDCSSHWPHLTCTCSALNIPAACRRKSNTCRLTWNRATSLVNLASSGTPGVLASSRASLSCRRATSGTRREPENSLQNLSSRLSLTLGSNASASGEREASDFLHWHPKLVYEDAEVFHGGSPFPKGAVSVAPLYLRV